MRGKKTSKGVTWTEEHLQQLLAAGTIKGYKVIGGGRQPTAPPAGAVPPTAPAPERNGKYNAQPTEVDGIKFASIKEGKRYRDLKLLELAGRIRDLRLQVEYELNPSGDFSYKYVADFVYIDTVTGEEVVEDVKGNRTREYKRKRKLMRKVHGIRILET